MSDKKQYNKTQHDEEAAKAEREGTYNLNLKWIQEQEACNLGLKKLPRNGDNAVYTNFGIGENKDGTACGIPAGLPIAFSDPMFQRKLRACPHHKQAFPGWDFECKVKQDLSNPLATDEQIKEMVEGLKAVFAGKYQQRPLKKIFGVNESTPV